MKTFNLNKNLFYIDGFYYCTSDEEIKEGDWYFDEIENDIFTSFAGEVSIRDRHKIIFTNNPSIPVTQLVIPDKEDEIEELAFDYSQPTGFTRSDCGVIQMKAFIAGYKANPNTFTDDDMIGFAEWIEKNKIGLYEGKWEVFANHKTTVYTTKELLSLYIKSKEKLIESFDVSGEFICKNGHSMNYQTSCVYPHCEEPNHWQSKLTNNKIVALNVKYK